MRSSANENPFLKIEANHTSQLQQHDVSFGEQFK